MSKFKSVCIFIFNLCAAGLALGMLEDRFQEGEISSQLHGEGSPNLLVKVSDRIQMVETCPGPYSRVLLRDVFSDHSATGSYALTFKVSALSEFGDGFGPAVMLRLFIDGMEQDTDHVTRINIKKNGRVGIFYAGEEHGLKTAAGDNYLFRKTGEPVFVQIAVDFDEKVFEIIFDGHRLTNTEGDIWLPFSKSGQFSVGGLEVASRVCEDYIPFEFDEILIKKLTVE